MSQLTSIVNGVFAISADFNKQLRPMTLQKYIYLTCGMWYATADEKSWLLGSDDFQAWKYGPVVEDVYHQYKHYGARPISYKDKITSTDSLLPSVLYTINEVLQEYGKLSDIELSMLTHGADTPWSSVYQQDVKNIIIPRQSIKRHFQKIKEIAPVEAINRNLYANLNYQNSINKLQRLVANNASLSP